jgi:hypothetical protein
MHFAYNLSVPFWRDNVIPMKIFLNFTQKLSRRIFLRSLNSLPQKPGAYQNSQSTRARQSETADHITLARSTVSDATTIRLPGTYEAAIATAAPRFATGETSRRTDPA